MQWEKGCSFLAAIINFQFFLCIINFTDRPYIHATIFIFFCDCVCGSLSLSFFLSFFWLIGSFFYRSKPRHQSFDIFPSLCIINTTTFYLLTFGSRGSVKFLSFKALNLDFLSSRSSIVAVSSLEIDCFSGCIWWI
jgi:hypothetical protein